MVNGTGVVKLYNMAEPEPGRLPYHVTPFTFTPVNSHFPAEVALCLSFRASPEVGANPRRRRGRIFLGPMAANSADILSHDLRPKAATRGTIGAAALVMGLGVSGAARHAIYSPTTDVTASLEDSFHDVEDYWIDDSFDTVRSRGARPTTRDTFNVVG
jgi:hypothetical protein